MNTTNGFNPPFKYAIVSPITNMNVTGDVIVCNHQIFRFFVKNTLYLNARANLLFNNMINIKHCITIEDTINAFDISSNITCMLFTI